LIEERLVNPSCKDKKGETPLHVACRWAHKLTTSLFCVDIILWLGYIEPVGDCWLLSHCVMFNVCKPLLGIYNIICRPWPSSSNQRFIGKLLPDIRGVWVIIG
jgi:hypothetical protein